MQLSFPSKIEFAKFCSQHDSIRLIWIGGHHLDVYGFDSIYLELEDEKFIRIRKIFLCLKNGTLEIFFVYILGETVILCYSNE